MAAPVIDSYLNIGAAAGGGAATGCGAIHPGYGFLSERAPFAKPWSGRVWYSRAPASAIRAMGARPRPGGACRPRACPSVPGSDPAARRPHPGPHPGGADRISRGAQGGGRRGKARGSRHVGGVELRVRGARSAELERPGRGRHLRGHPWRRRATSRCRCWATHMGASSRSASASARSSGVTRTDRGVPVARRDPGPARTPPERRRTRRAPSATSTRGRSSSCSRPPARSTSSR